MSAVEPSNLALFWAGVIVVAILVYVILDGFDLGVGILFGTTRDRFAAHTTDLNCKGCHLLLDPVGFGFEHYGADGSYRQTENGRLIDATGAVVASADIDGDFDGVSYKFTWPGSISNRTADRLLNPEPIKISSPLTTKPPV